MSIMGTGPAAAVAQTGLNAQQQARKTDKARGDQQKVARETAAAFVERLNTPADADDAGGELPDRGALGYENLYGPDGQPHGPGFDAAGGRGDASGPDAAPGSGLDVTG